MREVGSVKDKRGVLAENLDKGCRQANSGDHGCKESDKLSRVRRKRNSKRGHVLPWWLVHEAARMVIWAL